MKFKALRLALALAAMAPGAVAAETEHVGEIAGWDVYVDHGEGLGCFIHSEFDDGTSFRIGFQNNGESAYLFALNPDWDFFETGAEYALTADVDGAAFEGIGVGTELEGVPGIDIAFDNEDFANLLTEGSVLTVAFDDAELYALDISGADEAILMAVLCEMGH